MFAYYLRLGVSNLRRNPALTALMLLTLGVGVAASMATLTVLHVMSGDPIPHKSERLFSVVLDNGPDGERGPSQQQNLVPYRDVRELKDGAFGLRQTGLYGIAPAIDSGRDDLPPFFAAGSAVHRDFFAMFETPFAAGGAWTDEADRDGARVVVIERRVAERVFGSAAAAVGEDLVLGETPFQVTGVLDGWSPLPRFYRLSGQDPFGDSDDVFIPIAAAVDMQMDPSGSINCSAGGALEPGFDGLLRSECSWLNYWIETATVAEADALRDHLRAHVEEQRRSGRFPYQGEVVSARNVMQWLDFLQVVGSDVRLQTWLAFGFLLVCLVNIIGLLLAKFTARSSEIGVRRALGAPRIELFKQYLIEAGVVGFAGGALGLLLTVSALWLMASQSPNLEKVARMDGTMLGATLALSIGAALLAGLLPTWRASQVRPAAQLKSQ
ncbi:MAG TPA: ABC transporter permease [Xanthomonadaceae bacterium]|nr:ABC transporter permease [Xanthomonadaceae bacterium]